MIAFDTNVLVYALDGSDPIRKEKAIAILGAAGPGLTLWQVACEFIAASRKLERDGLSQQDAWDELSRVLIAYPLALPGAQVLDRRRALHVDQKWSFWDATIVAACLDAGVTRLYSEDLPGRAPPRGLEIINPFA